MPSLDLILRGGTVIDPARGLHGVMDVGFAGGRIASVASSIVEPAAEVIDVTGKLVTAGLIDLHGHFYAHAQPMWVDPDETCLPTGVTTGVDGGSTGWATYRAFRDNVINRCDTRILTFLHLATTGQISLAAGVGELQDFRYAQEERTRDAFKIFPELLGVKVRIGVAATGEANALPAIQMARRVVDATGTRLMAHISGTPIELEQILDRLNAGDTATHIFNGFEHGPLDEKGRVKKIVRDAAARGVVLDIAHGGWHFDVEVAKKAVAQDLWPTTLSTDRATPIIPRVMYNLLEVMSMFLALGMPLRELIRAVTEAPARAVGREGILGTLTPGAEGDAAVLEIEEGEFSFPDAAGHQLPGRQRFASVLTVHAGRRWRRR